MKGEWGGCVLQTRTPEGRGHVSPAHRTCLRSGQCFLHEAGGSLREGLFPVLPPGACLLPHSRAAEEQRGACHPETLGSPPPFPEWSPLLLGGRVTRSFSEAPLRGVAGSGGDQFPQRFFNSVSAPAAHCPPPSASLDGLPSPSYELPQMLRSGVTATRGYLGTGQRPRVHTHPQEGPEGRTRVGRSPGRGC